MDVLAKIRELAEHEELSAFDASGTPVSSALRMAAAEIERLRAALQGIIKMHDDGDDGLWSAAEVAEKALAVNGQ